jgi:twitching motility protein PilU
LEASVLSDFDTAIVRRRNAEAHLRVAALEILINSPRIKKLILEGETTKIPAAIQGSRTEGMQTFNQALVDLVKAGKIEDADALRFSPKSDELKMNLKGIFSGTGGLT